MKCQYPESHADYNYAKYPYPECQHVERLNDEFHFAKCNNAESHNTMECQMQVAIIPSVIILSAKYAECCRATFSPVFNVFFGVATSSGPMKTSQNKPISA